MSLRWVLVSARHVESQKIHIKRMLLPYTMKQHHHWYFTINRHSQLALFLDRNYRSVQQTEWGSCKYTVRVSVELKTGKNSQKVEMNIKIPLKDEIGCGSPGKWVTVFAFHQVYPVGAHHYVQAHCFGIDRDGAKVRVQLVVFHFLTTYQLAIDCNPYMTA